MCDVSRRSSECHLAAETARVVFIVGLDENPHRTIDCTEKGREKAAAWACIRSPSISSLLTPVMQRTEQKFPVKFFR